MSRSSPRMCAHGRVGSRGVSFRKDRVPLRDQSGTTLDGTRVVGRALQMTAFYIPSQLLHILAPVASIESCSVELQVMVRRGR